MTICDRWAVAVVPFPFVDALAAKPRPALVLSSRRFNADNAHTLLAMITRGVDTKWPSDLTIERFREAGLPLPSVVRWKLFTLDNRLVARTLGALAPTDRRNCAAALKEILAIG